MVINSNLDSPWREKTVAVEWREGRVTRRSGPAGCLWAKDDVQVWPERCSDDRGLRSSLNTQLNQGECCWWACPCWCARQHQVQQGVKVTVEVTSNVVHDKHRSGWHAHTSLSFFTFVLWEVHVNRFKTRWMRLNDMYTETQQNNIFCSHNNTPNTHCSFLKSSRWVERSMLL